MDIWDKDDEDMNAIRAGLEAMVKNIRRDSTEGLVLPFGYTFELTSTGGSGFSRVDPFHTCRLIAHPP